MTRGLRWGCIENKNRQLNTDKNAALIRSIPVDQGRCECMYTHGRSCDRAAYPSSAGRRASGPRQAGSDHSTAQCRCCSAADLGTKPRDCASPAPSSEDNLVSECNLGRTEEPKLQIIPSKVTAVEKKKKKKDRVRKLRGREREPWNRLHSAPSAPWILREGWAKSGPSISLEAHVIHE